MSPKIFNEAERETKRTEMLEAGLQLLKEYGMTHMSVEKITAKAKLGKGTFYHFFDSKEDFICQLIEHQRMKFWNYIDILKDGNEKMSEENGKRLIEGIIFNENSVYQYLTLDESYDVYEKEIITPNLEEESEILKALFAQIENVKDSPHYGVISNLLKIMAMAASGRNMLHISEYEETQRKLFGLLWQEIFNDE